MKTIGVIGAMPIEVTLLRDRLSNLTTEKCAGLELFIGELHGKKVVVCQSGMGKVAAAGATQLLITKYNVDAVINSGIAGNTSSLVSVGDVVISKTIMYHDAQLDMIEQHYPHLQEYVADQHLVDCASKACDITNTKHITARIATGDKFIGDKETKNSIMDFCSPACVEMEGAAIAHIATKNDIPFVIVRAMSDDADENALETLNGKTFDIQEYCDKAADICEACIKQI